MRALIRFDCFGVIFMTMFFTSFVCSLESNCAVAFSEFRSCPGVSPQRRFASSSQTLFRSFPCNARKVRSLRCSSSPRLSWQSHIPFGSLFSFQGTMKRSFTYSYWEAASDNLKRKNICKFENPSHLFAQRVSKCTPVLGLCRKNSFVKFIPPPIPTGKSQMHTLNRKKFLPIHLFGIGVLKRTLFFRKNEKIFFQLRDSLLLLAPKVPSLIWNWKVKTQPVF